MKLGSLFAVFLFALSVFAADEAPKRSVQVRGTGSISAVPDRVSFVAGVETASPSLKTAFADNKRIVAAALKAMRDRGVTDAEMRTANFAINMQYENEKRSSRLYVVSNAVTVTRSKIDDVASLVEAAVDAGANNVNSIAYSIADPAPLLDAALERAYADARARAQHLAAAAGRQVGDPIEITTEGFYAPQPVTEAITVAPSSPALEMLGGTKTVTANVLVTFELK
ncbi:MAG TPA: SIMPL domain-containing protein [Vicinamibacterales bacterium]|nr:SIMPL domain-containing protein [Vicinamibacterales bacterium]